MSGSVGRRTAEDMLAIAEKIEHATSSRFQLTTAGFVTYPEAVHYSLGTRMDSAQRVKIHTAPRDPGLRYSPFSMVNVVPTPRWGSPDGRRFVPRMSSATT
jgi:hypothetical protein